MRRGLILALMLALAGCIPRSEPPPQQRPRPERPPREEPPSATTRQCLSELRDERVEFRLLEDRRYSGGCSAIGAVQLLDIGTPTTNLEAMTCPLARQFARWTREAVQPAASRFLDSRVVRIETFGTYACRGVNGQAGARLSEHAFANAVDVSGFVLADGRRVTVEAGWDGDDGDVRQFLRTIHEAGCRRFNITLGPDANRFHYNHMHFDMGRGPYCR
ncbi:extensin family protein [Sphingosinicella sp. LHD-64]|uniref:extensin family protein n=1 Tax=Sphingosinicella sp. LHD-64 TaxID=3072139 RepID=UPI00281014F3|nr:extensin family protein [Sphingosinicella sp. LHD-64]MDQ8756179.1 extensin family protein [Sphingosinicella sp. LHD-64]